MYHFIFLSIEAKYNLHKVCLNINTINHHIYISAVFLNEKGNVAPPAGHYILIKTDLEQAVAGCLLQNVCLEPPTCPAFEIQDIFDFVLN